MIRYPKLREHIPLKQGLRQAFSYFYSLCFITQRAYSIKTRIKTALFLLKGSPLEVSESIFH